ncbi:hypothetical protein WUBG_14066, partial [Wuchereria bancrofti]
MGTDKTGPLYQTSGRVRCTFIMSADVVSSLRLIVCHFFGVQVGERWDDGITLNITLTKEARKALLDTMIMMHEWTSRHAKTLVNVSTQTYRTR